MAKTLPLTLLTEVFMLLGELEEITKGDDVDPYRPSVRVYPDGECRLYLTEGHVPVPDFDVATLRDAKHKLEELVAEVLRDRRLKIVQEFSVSIKVKRGDPDPLEPGPASAKAEGKPRIWRVK